MQISSNTWHYRVFEWALKQKHGYIPWDIEHNGSNLCPYVRTVAIWAPLRFLFNTTKTRFIATLLTIFAAITGLIYKFKGLRGLKMEFQALVVAIIMCAVVAIIVGLFFLIEKIQQYRRNRNMKFGISGPIVSFIEILVKYARSAHRGICPKITFTEKEPS